MSAVEASLPVGCGSGSRLVSGTSSTRQPCTYSQQAFGRAVGRTCGNRTGGAEVLGLPLAPVVTAHKHNKEGVEKIQRLLYG